ncbi:MAG: CubicO group peptidase (beta-lactamase class C family) [Chlamydiales bacterium]|jgi:CubicO group peptidase (beta-lactamase class C family)
MTLLALTAILGTCLPCPTASGDLSSVDERCEALASQLDDLALRAGVPGVSIALTNRDGLQWSGTSGVRDARQPGAVDRNTVFEAASLSKPVFAYAVLQLVDEGLLELDTPLVEYAPLNDIAHDPRHKKLTARMVLSHSTGLPNWRPDGGRLDFEADPGSGWRYSGEGFVLLQRVIETLIGDNLQGLAQALVFEPLGMTRSSFVWKPEFNSNVAFPHDGEGQSREVRHVSEPNAAASLLTTAPDYARFLAALLSGEQLSADLHKQLLKSVVTVNEHGVAWGLGIGLEQNPDGPAFWHWGHNSGFRAYTIGYPSRGTAIVYFANSDNGMRFLRDVVQLATGDEEHPAIDHLAYPSYAEAE